MSLILEALRKSEAERRRGQTPDLLTDAMPAASAARRAPPNWTVLLPVIGAALITLLLVAWWLRPSAEPVVNGDAADGDAANAAGTGDASVSARVTASSPPTGSAPVQQPTLSPPIGPASAPAVAAASTSMRPAPALPATATPAPPAATTQARVPAAAAAAAESQPKPALPTPAQVASIEQPAPADLPSFASPDAPIKLSDLSGEDRARLPALKVSMHMWAPEAGNRFAIIDGTRVNEGDRVGEAMIEAIHQDSVVLSWQGRQIRLPIR